MLHASPQGFFRAGSGSCRFALVRGDTPLKTCHALRVADSFIFGISKPLCVAGCLTHRELEGRVYAPLSKGGEEKVPKKGGVRGQKTGGAGAVGMMWGGAAVDRGRFHSTGAWFGI